jgi:predicted DNA-binding transcriptional regulator AlpA
VLNALSYPRVVPASPEARPVYRKAAVCTWVGFSSRTLDRMRSNGSFPEPDGYVNRCPYWRRETVQYWLDRGGFQVTVLPPSHHQNDARVVSAKLESD